MRSGIFFLSFLLVLASCNGHSELDKALRLSGDNRIELEKVIRHFSQDTSDSLKLKAALFLIENMPGHCSVVDSCIVDYYLQVDLKNKAIPFYLKNILYNLPQYYVDLSGVKKVEDVKVIKSDFLINHIENMFHIWEKVPWGKDISFETFCEYILPYRLDGEPLTKLMEHYYYFPIDSFSQQFEDYNITVDEFLYNYIWRLLPQCGREFELTSPVGEHYVADCIWDSYKVLSESRLSCIPAAIDFTPCWPSRNGKHFWNIIEDPCLVKKTFSENYIDHYAKVYRKTYSRNPFPESSREDSVPALFKTPFIKDVTELYCKTVDIVLMLQADRKPEYAYLSVFNMGVWEPVAWSRVVGNDEVSFKKMGMKCVYLPVFYNGKEEVSGGYPFIATTTKTIHKLIPDRQRPIKVRLTRKYPVNPMAYGLNNALKNLKIERSDFYDFRKTEAFRIGRIENDFLQEIVLTSSKKYRYWKITSDMIKEKPQIAEIYFYDQNNNLISSLVESVIGSDKSEAVKIFDNKPLTFSVIESPIILDMDKLPNVSKIKIMPRNDDNYIVPGNLYELLYRDRDGWVSLGTKISNDYFLNYDNVPSGALYWLKNHTRGIEERIFTIENGKQIFW